MFSRFKLSLIFVCAIFSSYASAQDSEIKMDVPKLSTPVEDARQFKIKTSPLSLLVGGYDIDLSTRLAKSSWSVGLYGERTNTDWFFTQKTGYGVGFNSTYFFRGSPFVSSWYISPALTYRWGHEKDTDILFDIGGDYKTYSLSAMLGYQWHLQTFNLGLGIGAAADEVQISNARISSPLAAAFGGDPNQSAAIQNSGESSWTMQYRIVAELTAGWSF